MINIFFLTLEHGGTNQFITCVALAKAGLVVGPLRPSVRNFWGDYFV